MDNNNQNPTAPGPLPVNTPPVAPTPAPVPAASPAPAPAAAPTMAQQPTEAAITPTVTEVKSNGKMKWIIIGVVLLLVLGGAGYWYYTNNMNQAPSTAPVVSAPETKTDSIASLQQELDSILVSSVEADFTQLDQDLNSL
jgi:hypothetical protein